jgi:hypothetical protein
MRDPYRHWLFRLHVGYLVGAVLGFVWGIPVIFGFIGIASGTLFPATILPIVAGKPFYYLMWSAVGSLGGTMSGPFLAAILCHAPTRGRVFRRAFAGGLAGLVIGNIAGSLAYWVIVENLQENVYNVAGKGLFYGFYAGLFSGAMVSLIWRSAGHAEGEDC